MRRKRVVISGQSLFAGGIGNRLRECLPCVDLEIVGRREPDAMPQITAPRPSIVILMSPNLGSPNPAL
jgi:hypothetical protein